MLFRTNQETGPAIDLFQQASLVSKGQWCGPFVRPEFINHSLKLMWNLWRHTRNATFFARPIRKCGNKTRQPEVCCGDATLGVE